MAKVNSNDENDNGSVESDAQWLADIEAILEESGLLTMDRVEIEEDQLVAKGGETSVYYIVGTTKNEESERIATVYVSPSESYDAEAVADIFAATFELIPELVERLKDADGTVGVVQSSTHKLSAISFMVDRAMEAAKDENASIETLRSLISLIHSILYSGDKIDLPVMEATKKENGKVSLLHLLPESARSIFGA